MNSNLFKIQFSYKLYWIIFGVIIIQVSSLIVPVLNSNDAYFYAVISKNLLYGHSWYKLTYLGHDWLDKPHLPFWLSAISFKFFGINPFAYILPGLIFHFLGAIYTFKLARYLYNSAIGLIAVTIYLTTLHLLLSAIDVRAEAYLLGEIMPAVYYWLKYDNGKYEKNEFGLKHFKYLLLGSFFTGLALMTKGLFVLVTIFSGLIINWIYNQKLKKIISFKWLFAYFLSIMWIVPELIALYLQFDIHPDKLIYGQKKVSGIWWYFWGSQFGRFFNTGPIVNTHGNLLFFVHTFLWAFLPWSIIFIFAMNKFIRQYRNCKTEDIYLFSSFWSTFIMFSLTKFQLDHYTNIIMPFAAIICANYLYEYDVLKNPQTDLLYKMQTILSKGLLIITIILGICTFKFSIGITYVLIPVCCLFYMIFCQKRNYRNIFDRIVLFPAITIMIVYLLLMLVNDLQSTKYNAGYNIAQVTNKFPLRPIYVYKVDGLINNLTFSAQNNVFLITNLNELTNKHQIYLLISDKQTDLSNQYQNQQMIKIFVNLPLEKTIPSLLSTIRLHQNLEQIKLVYIP